ncbi:DNA-processing protein DprA [Fibrobacterota bacterium]
MEKEMSDCGTHELKMRLSLYLKSNVGPASYKKLLLAFVRAERIFSSSPTELKAICPYFRDNTVKDILRGPDLIEADRQLELCRKYGVRILEQGSEEYPSLPDSLYNPPPFIFVRGKWPLGSPCLGVVGTRSPTEYGNRVTRKMVGTLARKKFTIVSGLAKGIDTVAHHTTLDHGGHTVAVLGTGLDIVYPENNINLFKSIWDRGTLVTEYPFGTPPEAKNFPLRNRIISGLSLGILIVEAGTRSGALITCHHAGKQGKPIFAVPGSAFNRKADGPHKLIQDGAHLAFRPADIESRLVQSARGPGPQHSLQILSMNEPGEEFLNSETGSPKNKPAHQEILLHLSDAEKKIYSLLEKDTLSLDRLSELSGSAPHALLVILLSLEAKNLVKRNPGSIFCQNL